MSFSFLGSLASWFNSSNSSSSNSSSASAPALVDKDVGKRKKVVQDSSRPRIKFSDLLDPSKLTPISQQADDNQQQRLAESERSIKRIKASEPESIDLTAQEEKPLFSANTKLRQLEAAVSKKLKQEKQVQDSSSSSSSSSSAAATHAAPADVRSESSEEAQLHRDDVWGKGSQYADLRGRLICTPATAHCLASLAKGKKIASDDIDAFLANGLESYKEILGLTAEEWEKARKDAAYARERLYPIDYFECMKTVRSGLQEKETYDVASPIPMINHESGDIPSYLPLKPKEFESVFGPVIKEAQKQKGKPVVAFLVVGKAKIAVAETFGLCVQQVGKQMTFKLFNPHGTDASRNEESGIKTAIGRPGPARLNSFMQESLFGTPQEEFSHYFSNLIANIFADEDTRITVSIWGTA